MGADAVLVNTAIAQAQDPGQMGTAFKQGVSAGRNAYLAGRIGVRKEAIASSPTTDVPQPVSASS
jgi:thiazole synthase